MEVKKEAGDEFILLGSDGIWERHVEDSEGLVEMVKNGMKEKGSEEVVEDLLDEFLAKNTSEGMGCDNMTAILVMLK